jgi:hypothetical protein
MDSPRLPCRASRSEGKLPFPDFDVEFRKTHRDTLDYPPTGSPGATKDDDQK